MRLLHRSRTLLSLPFPIRATRDTKLADTDAFETESNSEDFTGTRKRGMRGEDGELARNAKLRTKSVDGKIEVDTYITGDGGRIDFIKKDWPPVTISVVEASLAEVRVKYGVPWPSLYHALDPLTDSVKLRYIVDSAFPDVSGLRDDMCDACVGGGDDDAAAAQAALYKPLRIDADVEQFCLDCVFKPVNAWRWWLYTRWVDWGEYRYYAAIRMGVTQSHLLSKAQLHDLIGSNGVEDAGEKSVDDEGTVLEYGEEEAGGLRQRPTEAAAKAGTPRRYGSCLDIGAGSGDVSVVFKEHLGLSRDEYHVTEIDSRMSKHLRKRGFTAFTVDSIDDKFAELSGRSRYDLVLCLNVLDRCFSLTRMVDECVKATAPGGTLILSLPLPLRQAQHRLGLAQENVWPPHFNRVGAWEHAAAWFARYVLERHGGSQLTLKRLARAPYLSNGPASAPVNCLDTAVYVFEKTSDPKYADSVEIDSSTPMGAPIIL